MGNNDFSAVINGVQHFASDLEQLVGHAVNEIMNLGISMFNGLEWFVHFLIDLQEDPVHVISRMAARIGEIGASVASVLEEIVNGIRANGLIGYLRINVQNALTPFHTTMDQQVTQSNQLTTLHQNTVSTMKQKLDTLKNNGTDASWRGPSVDAMSASFAFHSSTLTNLSGVFNNQNSVTNVYAQDMEINNFMALIAVFAVLDLLIILCGVVGIAFTFGTSTLAAGELLTLAVIGEVAILLIYAEVYNLAWQHGTLGLYQGVVTTTQGTQALSASSVQILTPGQRSQGVQDAWDAIEKELAGAGKTMNDLIKIVGSATMLKQMIEMLVCMGYSTAEITSLLTGMVANPALSNPYTTPAGATGVTVTGSDTLPSLLQKLLEANATGNTQAYNGYARMIKAIMDIGPANIKGLDVQYLNPPGSPGNSDADIITNNGDIYEIGGSDKKDAFGDQDLAHNTFIRNGGTGNTGGDIHLWMDSDGKVLAIAQALYETGKPPNPNNPNTAPYERWLRNPNFKKPKDVTQKTPRPWICGTGYTVK